MWTFKHWTQTNNWKWCSRFGEQHTKGAIFYAICTFVEFTMKTIYFLRIHFIFCVLVSLFLLHVALFALVHLFDYVPYIVNRSIRIQIFGQRFYPFNYSLLSFSFFLLVISSGLFHVAQCSNRVHFPLFWNKTDKYFFATRFYFFAGFAGYCKIHLDLSVDTSSIHTTGNKLEANRRIVNWWRKKVTRDQRVHSTQYTEKYGYTQIYVWSMSISRTKCFFLFVIAVFRFDSFFFCFCFLTLFFFLFFFLHWKKDIYY